MSNLIPQVITFLLKTILVIMFLLSCISNYCFKNEANEMRLNSSVIALGLMLLAL